MLPNDQSVIYNPPSDGVWLFLGERSEEAAGGGFFYRGFNPVSLVHMAVLYIAGLYSLVVVAVIAVLFNGGGEMAGDALLFVAPAPAILIMEDEGARGI